MLLQFLTLIVHYDDILDQAIYVTNYVINFLTKL
jgi:hypothetical protein